MSFNEKTGLMDWRDEFSWVLIAIVSGILLAVVYRYFNRFHDVEGFLLAAGCSAAFYFISILLRIHNYRGQLLTGRTALNERKLKYIFPIVGFAFGIAIFFI